WSALRRKEPRRDLLAQNLLHRLALRELVDQLVEIPDLLLQRIRNLLDANAANDALDQRARGIQGRRLREKGLEVAFPIDLLLQAGFRVAGQPADDPVHFLVRPILALGLLDVQRIHLRELDRADGTPRHGPARNASAYGSATVRFRFGAFPTGRRFTSRSVAISTTETSSL